MICEAQRFIDSERQSVVKEIFKEIFSETENNNCDAAIFRDCSLSLIHYILASLNVK